jgi:hypothetical protein
MGAARHGKNNRAMYAISLGASPRGYDESSLERELDKLRLQDPAWVLMYATVEAPVGRVMNALRRHHPKLPMFGATSFQGVFTRAGFSRGVALLVGENSDNLPGAVELCETGAAHAEERARKACVNLERSLGQRPQVLLLHATPGFEERILEGVRAAFGTEVPVYGGSAADDTITGDWSVFANGARVSEGFVLAGLGSASLLRGAFLGGYLPSEHGGTVTRAKGRTVFEIDGRPAAQVYGEWVNGAIANEVEHGGSVLLKTNLLPVARSMGGPSVVPRRLLSHPHEVVAQSRALKFFSEFSVGDQITLMTGTKDPLVTRVRRSVQRARVGPTQATRGGLLVYCGGCLGALLDRAPEIAREFADELGNVPFIGIATFGEQGRFFDKSESLHGNLMCTVLLF